MRSNLQQILSQRVRNPQTGNQVTVRYALRLPKTHPAYKAAQALIKKFSATPRTVQSRKSSTTDTPERTQLRQTLLAVLNKRSIDTSRFVRRALPAGADTKMKELDAFGKKFLGGISPFDIAMDYISSLGPIRPDEIKDFDVSVSHGELGSTFYFALTLNNETEISRSINYRNSTKLLTIGHEMFVTEQRAIGAGFAKRMLRTSLDIADRIGADRITFLAGLGSGGYVWAKYGGIIKNPEERRQMYKTVLSALGALYPDHPQARYFKNTDYLRLTERAESMATMSRFEIKRAKGILIILRDELKAAREKNDQRIMKDLVAEITTRKTELEKYIRQLKLATDFQEFVKNDPAVILELVDLLDNETLEADTDPHLLSYIANIYPLGPMLLLGTGWGGYFDLTKGSPGRAQFEQAIK